MAFQLPDAGAVSPELAREIHLWWQTAAENADIDLSGFDPDASLDARIAWALELGLDIGTGYSRYSSKRQHSTSDQVRTCAQHAAIKRIYCPPEFVWNGVDLRLVWRLHFFRRDSFGTTWSRFFQLGILGLVSAFEFAWFFAARSISD